MLVAITAYVSICYVRAAPVRAYINTIFRYKDTKNIWNMQIFPKENSILMPFLFRHVFHLYFSTQIRRKTYIYVVYI